jgi:hypothetical protein
MKAKDLLKLLQNRPKNLPVYIEVSWSINGVESEGYLPLILIAATNKGHILENGVDTNKALIVKNIVDYLKVTVQVPIRMLSINVGSKPTISYPEIDLKAFVSSIRKVRGKGYYMKHPHGKNKVLLLTGY